jgi:hypothetical protein
MTLLVSKLLTCPDGEGGPKGQVTGNCLFFTPHPTLRVALSLQESSNRPVAGANNVRK